MQIASSRQGFFMEINLLLFGKRISDSLLNIVCCLGICPDLSQIGILKHAFEAFQLPIRVSSSAQPAFPIRVIRVNKKGKVYYNLSLL